MNCEGIVSSRNEILWTFEVDKEVSVFMGHLVAFDTNYKLPPLGAYVRISNAYFKGELPIDLKLFLSKTSTLTIQESRNINSKRRKGIMHEKLPLLIQTYNIGADDLLLISKNIPSIEKFLKPLSLSRSEEIVMEIASLLAKQVPNKPENIDPCLNQIIPKFSVQTIAAYKNVDVSSEKESMGPPWSFGVYSKCNGTDILIGWLEIDKYYGLIFLRDSKYKMPCIITTKTRHFDKRTILNKFVLIKEYNVFTEVYRDLKGIALEYINFDVENVMIINAKPLRNSSQTMLVNNLPDDFNYKHHFKFKLLSKGPVTYVNQLSTVECWLEILWLNNERPTQGYLGLNNNQIKILSLLNEGQLYNVYHFYCLKDYKPLELQRLNYECISLKFNESNPIFVPQDEMDACISEDTILSVGEALNKIKEVTHCISFQGLLLAKKMTKPLPSRTQTAVKIPGFGTPGAKTHCLTFVGDTKAEELTLYINNWETLQVPLGLIINMRVCVRNVLPQNQKYLKCTAMTTFSAISYEPPVTFQTASLNKFHGCIRYSFVGLGNKIPEDVIIWTRTLAVHIRSLRIWCKCTACNNNLYFPGTCMCNSEERNIEVRITLVVHDEYGNALIISKSLHLLQVILGLLPWEFEKWCTVMKYVSQYIHKAEEIKHENECVELFRRSIYNSVRILNAMKIVHWSLKCRKMASDKNDYNKLPKWFCVDVMAETESL